MEYHELFLTDKEMNELLEREIALELGEDFVVAFEQPEDWPLEPELSDLAYE